VSAPYRILVTGSRNWSDWQTLSRGIFGAWHDAADPCPVTIIQGGASGADLLAAQLARKCGWNVETHPADWARYGRAAGFRRNDELVALGAYVCLVFIKYGSRGATHTADLAEKAGIRVMRYEVWTTTQERGRADD